MTKCCEHNEKWFNISINITGFLCVWFIVVFFKVSVSDRPDLLHTTTEVCWFLSLGPVAPQTSRVHDVAITTRRTSCLHTAVSCTVPQTTRPYTRGSSLLSVVPSFTRAADLTFNCVAQFVHCQSLHETFKFRPELETGGWVFGFVCKSEWVCPLRLTWMLLPNLCYFLILTGGFLYEGRKILIFVFGNGWFNVKLNSSNDVHLIIKIIWKKKCWP